MKRLLSLGIVIAILVAALVLAQKCKPQAPVGADAVLHFVGDTEQELSRLPMSATRLSDADEIRVGNELAERYKYMERLRDDQDEDQQFRQYIEKVGTTVSARAQRNLPYRFHYIPDQYMVNAFAIPGGHVYIGKGLIDLMDSEDELAAVLGHEIEHVDHRHAVERLKTQASLRHLGLLRLLVELPVEIFQAGYSKEQELEADREGTRLAVISGYSASGAVRMFEAFERRFREVREQQSKSPQEETARVVLATMSEYFRSHPSTPERITQIQSLIAQENWPPRAEKPFALGYLLWTDRAQIALQQHKYKEASALSSRALVLKPDVEKALRIHGDAEYHQANFRRAADSYRDLLKLQPNNVGYVQFYAFLLASSDRRTAAEEFSQALNYVVNSPEALDTLAAVRLLARNTASADKVYDDLKAAPNDASTPDRLAWLGWWYYVSGNSSRGLEMLNSAVQQRPSNPVYLVNLGWTNIEERRYADALNTLRLANSYAADRQNDTSDALPAEISMATAVAHWLADDRSNAISEYQAAIIREPSWANAEWYGPQYSATVSRVVGEMKVEVDRRKKAADISARQAQ
jgi:predicted Zn-dependent protease